MYSTVQGKTIMGHSNLLSFNMPPISKGGILGVLVADNTVYTGNA